TAALFLFAGSTKFMIPPEQLHQGPIALPLAFMYFIGIAEVLGGFGLVLPGLFKVQTWLTPLAAAGLTIIMVGAVSVTVAGMGVFAGTFPAVVGIVTTWIAYARTRVAPIADSHRAILRAA
ncbi:MAG TPA: DoxX family protein, partial [Gemmatimonadaceae bacterium]